MFKIKKQFSNRSGLLTGIFFAHFFCTFDTGHFTSPIGFIEFFVIIEEGSGNFNISHLNSLLMLAFVCTMVGQILIIIGLFQKDKTEVNKFGRFGIVGLITGVLIMFFALPRQIIMISLITISPFLILSAIFWTTNENTMDG